MPELPEVETVARLIRPRVVGRTIRSGEVYRARTVAGSKPAAFVRGVVGARVAEVWRRAKYVVLDLERDGEAAGHLVCHLRMTGRLHVEADEWDAGKFLRARFELDDGRALYFIDVRKFGKLWFARDLAALFGELGPEPLSDAFDADWLFDALRARKRQLKPLLLDQSFLAGLGNIYVDESLFRAGLHPLASSKRVDRESATRLHGAIRSILAGAIAREGSSFDTFYRTPEGNPGGFQNEFQVYAREGEPCVRCGAPISKIVVGQRGTHFCPRCQPRSTKLTSKSTRAASARVSRSR